MALKALIFATILLLCPLAANAATDQSLEVHSHKHTVIEIERDSPVWNQLPQAVKQKYLTTAAYDGWEGKPADVHDIFVIRRGAKGKVTFCIQHLGHLLHICELSGAGTLSKEVISYHEGSSLEHLRKFLRPRPQIITGEPIGDISVNLHVFMNKL